MTVLLTDHSRNAKVVVKQLQGENIFTNVIFAETKNFDYSYNRIKKIFEIFEIFIGRKWQKIISGVLPKIDIMLFYNYQLSTELIYLYLIQSNNELKCARFEEGLASYYDYTLDRNVPTRKLIDHKLHKLKLDTLDKRTDSFYCFYPDIYKGRLKPIGVDPIHSSDERFSSLLQHIFSIKNKLCYEQKYVYFASSLDSDNNIQVELDIVDKLSRLLGKKNILIKMHPRDRRSVYEEMGYQVDKNSAIPWEALQFCIDLSDKVLISTFSSSAISSNVMIDGGVETYYLYKLCDCDLPVVKKIICVLNETIVKLQEKDKCKKIKVVNVFNELVCDNP